MTGRKGIGGTMTVVIIIAVVMFNVLAYTVTNAFQLYLYSPQKDDLSISGNTDALFEDAIKIGKKVTITFCYTEEKLETHSTGSYVLETARNFAERYPEFIELKFVNLLTKRYDDKESKIAPLDNYCSVVCRNDVDTNPSDDVTKECGNVMRTSDVVYENGKPICTKCHSEILDYKNNIVRNFAQNSIIFETGTYGSSDFSYRVLTDRSTSTGFSDFYTLDASGNVMAYNGEEVMAAMISWILQKDHPVAYFTQNHGETADIAFSNLLTCAGYYVEVINLRKQEIPTDAGLLVISNPTTDFDRSDDDANFRGEINKIEAYLEGGGKLYVAIDPYVKQLTNLENMLTNWGITVSGGTTDDGAYLRDVVRDNNQAITPDGYSFVAKMAENDVADKIGDKMVEYGASGEVLLSSVVRLKLDRDKGAQPLLVSGNSSTTHRGEERTDNEGGYAVAAYSERTEKTGKTSTVFVLPTAYITATDAFLSENYSNKDFLYSTLEVLFDSHSAPRGCNQINYIGERLEGMTMGRARLYTAIILMLPTALAVVGIITIIRRKNR